MSESINVRENVSLAPLTTFKVGGKARLFVSAASEKEIIEAYEFADRNKLDVFVLGGGSNCLIADEGFDGLVIQIKSLGITIEKPKNSQAGAEQNSQGEAALKRFFLVTAQAGEDWDEFVEFCVEKNLAGLECLSGIPGCVGGTPIQNVGAYGQEVSESIERVRVFDRRTKEILELSPAECGFAYRRSIFNSTHKDRFIVLAVTFRLEEAGRPKIAYGDLLKNFQNPTSKPVHPTLAEVRETVRKIRADKGMLVRQTGTDAQSAGSFFKNPIVSKEEFSRIKKSAEKNGLVESGDEIPYFEVGEDSVKIPAAWLIEKSGFEKGFAEGAAGLSTKHTLALVNRGAAQASDLLALKKRIEDGVREKFRIELVPEPNFIGFEQKKSGG